MKTAIKKSKHIFGTVNDELVTKRTLRNFLNAYAQEIYNLVEIYLPEARKEELQELFEGYEDYEVDNLDECTAKEMVEFLEEKNDEYREAIAKGLDIDIEDKISDIEDEGYTVIKLQSLAQKIRFESFMNELETNPYQLKLVS